MPAVDVDVVIPGLRERFVDSFDGTPLCVQIVDDAPELQRPGLLIVNGLGATLLTWRLTVERFRRHFKIVSFDTRGLHKSGRPLGGAGALDVDAHARDVVAVADAVGFDRFHALGWSMGVQVLVEAAPLLRGRLLTLALHNGVAGRVFDDLPGMRRAGARGARAFDQVLARLSHNSGAVERVVSFVADHPSLIPAFVRVGLVQPELDERTFTSAARGYKNLDGELFLTILRHLGKHDAWGRLADVDVPALVVAGQKDKLTTLATMKQMVERLPRGELAVLDVGSHFSLMEHCAATMNDALAQFWSRHGVVVGQAA